MTTRQSGTAQKYVYLFGEGKADGSADMRNLLGGKGAGLAEMTNLGVPVPPGFTITTEVCTAFYDRGRQYPPSLEDQVREGVAYVERLLGRKFGDAAKPLLFSVRSGARVSMPGMMDTVLNLGLNDAVAAGLARETGDERFAYDSYRRFVSMYGDVVLGLKGEDKEVDPFEAILEAKKDALGVELDTELPASALKELVSEYKAEIKKRRGADFPDDPWDQLWGAVGAVFGSWENPRAVHYRRMYEIPGSWGTAVNVQAMVFGNLGNDCATGVGFTRDPSTGENRFYGEYLVNAQGEDVVAGIRTPQPVTIASKVDGQPALEETMPQAYSELKRVYESLEQHYRDMQDIEFTIQQGRLWLLQTRSGKRTGRAMVKVAVDMVREGLISKDEAVLRIEPDKLDELLHPTFDTSAKREVIATGLAASPGAAVGKVVFSADDAVEMVEKGEQVILVRIETSPEDIHGMKAAEGILTARGGMTSHAAVVARGMGRCCVAGCGALHVDYAEGVFRVNVGGKEVEVKEGDVISLDGSTGEVMLGSVPVVEGQLDEDFAELMVWVDEARRLKVRTNADTPFDAEVARKFGAEGIGLCRTEHMFFDPERILAVREMILVGFRSRPPRGSGEDPADAALRLRGHLPRHGRPARDNPPARPAAARVPAAHCGGDRRSSVGARCLGCCRVAAQPGPGGIQSDAGSPRLPACRHVPGDLRDAGARHHRGSLQRPRRRGRRNPRDHDPNCRYGGGAQAHARARCRNRRDRPGRKGDKSRHTR